MSENKHLMSNLKSEIQITIDVICSSLKVEGKKQSLKSLLQSADLYLLEEALYGGWLLVRVDAEYISVLGQGQGYRETLAQTDKTIAEYRSG